MLKQTLKTPILLLIGFLAALMLAACGGGGSGSGAPPSPFVGGGVETDGANAPTKDGDTYVLREDSVLTLKLSNASGLKASLAGVDIRSLFTINGNKASVSAYALQGIFASTNNAATLEVSVAGSSKSTLQLKYLAKPELVFTKVEGTGTGFDGTGLVFPKKSGGDYGVASTSEWPKNEVLPTSGEYLTVEGIVRGALAATITGGLQPVTPSPSNKFENEISGVNYQKNLDEGEADFSFTVTADNGEESTINLAMPGKVISDMFALQISDIGKDHLISQWINDALVSYLAAIDENNPLFSTTDCTFFEPLSGAGNNVKLYDVTLKPGNTNQVACTIKITAIKPASESVSELSFDTQLTFTKASDTNIDGWNVKAVLKPKQAVEVTLRTDYYYDTTGNGDYSSIAHGIVPLRFQNSLSVELNIDLGKVTGSQAKLFGVKIDYDNSASPKTKMIKLEQTLDTAGLGDCEGKDSTYVASCVKAPSGLSKGNVDTYVMPKVNDAIANVARCLRPYSYDFNPIIEDTSECGYSTVPTPSWDDIGELSELPIFIDPKASDANKKVVSAVQQQLTDSRFVSATNQKAGFVSFDGWEKTRDDGVHLNVLGTHFASAESMATTQVKTGKFENLEANDINMAISSNWINQMLLAAYQSKQLAGKDEVALCQKNDQNAYITPCKNLESLVNGAAPIVMQAIKSQVTNPIAVGVVADAVTPVRVHKLLRGLIKVEDSVGYQWAAHKAAPYVQFTNKKLELVASGISLKAWLIADIVGRLDNACTSAFSDYNGLGKADIVAGCQSALYVNGVRRDLLLASETGASHESVYIDVPSADIKLRMENTPSGVVESFAQDDFAIYINEPVGGTFPMGVLDAQSAIIPQLAEAIANLPTAVLADSTHCIVRKPTSTNKLMDAFFDWGVDVEDPLIEKQRAERKFSLLTSGIRIDATDANTGEASHIILAAKLLEGLQMDRLMGVTLEYKENCP